MNLKQNEENKLRVELVRQPLMLTTPRAQLPPLRLCGAEMQQPSDKAMSLPLSHPSAASPHLPFIPVATKSSVRLPRLGKIQKVWEKHGWFRRWEAASGGSVGAHFKLREVGSAARGAC